MPPLPLLLLLCPFSCHPISYKGRKKGEAVKGESFGEEMGGDQGGREREKGGGMMCELVGGRVNIKRKNI